MPDLSNVVTPQEYAAVRTRQFPSAESLRWFTRNHRPRLAKAGALLVIAGRNFIDPVAFDKVVAAVGVEKARATA